MLPTTSSSIRRDGNVLRVLPNFRVVGTLVWTVLSVAAVVCGLYHCRASSYNYLLSCEALSGACMLTSSLGDVGALRIERADITEVRVVRLGKGNAVVDTNGMRQREMRHLGSTLQLWYRRRADQRVDADGRPLHGAEYEHEHEHEALGVITTLLFPPLDMGANVRHAKSGKRRLDEFLEGRTDRAKVRPLLFSLLSLLSFALALSHVPSALALSLPFATGEYGPRGDGAGAAGPVGRLLLAAAGLLHRHVGRRADQAAGQAEGLGAGD